MSDQHTNLLQAILLELKCMNEALRTTASQGDAMPLLEHLGERVLTAGGADLIADASATSEQTKRFIAGAMLAEPITEPMIEAGIDALEEVANVSYLRSLAAEVYTAMELARQKGLDKAGKAHPC